MGHVGAGRDAPCFEVFEDVGMGVGQGGLDLTETVRDERKLPLCDDLRIELLEGAGRRVAWVGEGGFALGFSLGIESIEGRDGPINFAADFQDGGPGRCAVEAQRDGPDGSDILGDVVAGGAVASCGGLNELAILVAE